MKTALSIAGFDPTSGAGVSSDIKVFRSQNVYGLGIVSSITAQNTLGLQHIEPVSGSSVAKQLNAVLDDILPDASKAGMIYDKGIINLICNEIDAGRIKNMVVDPVILSSTGRPLLRKDALKPLINELIPRCRVVSPNIHEASVITGISIYGIEEMYLAAEKFCGLGAENVVIKGGHLENMAVDVLFDGEKYYEYKSDKISGWYHGTGCVFSAAIAAGIASGRSVQESVKKAKVFMKRSIEKSLQIGKGMKFLGI